MKQINKINLKLFFIYFLKCVELRLCTESETVIWEYTKITFFFIFQCKFFISLTCGTVATIDNKLLRIAYSSISVFPKGTHSKHCINIHSKHVYVLLHA